MLAFPRNKHIIILLLSLLITLFFSLPSLAPLRLEANDPAVETQVIQRFFYLLMMGYLLVVPLFYVNLPGKLYLRSWVSSRLTRFIIIGLVNVILLIVLTRLSVALQEALLRDLPWIGRLRGVYLFRSIIILGIVLLTVHLLELFQRSQRTSLENARLREENVKTQLAVLKAQINPHFLFNSLNSLAAVIRTDREESLRFVQKLSEVFRYILRGKQQDLASVREEMQFLEAYLFMLNKRFGDKLVVDVRVDKAAYERKVPLLALQTLVENAVKHNVITSARPLTVTMVSTPSSLVVSNNLQEKSPTEESYGIGLVNLSKRYQLLAQRSIDITKTDARFEVALPLI